MITSIARCLSCKYDLRNLTENRCPECGREFDPNDPSTFFDPARRKRHLWWIIELVIFSAVFYLIVVTMIVLVDYGQIGLRPWRRPTFFTTLVRALVAFPFAVPFGLLSYFLWRSTITWAMLTHGRQLRVVSCTTLAVFIGLVAFLASRSILDLLFSH